MAERIGKIASALVTATIIFVLLFMQSQISVTFAADVEENTYERVIAHGAGAYKGYETTNSMEAVNNAIANGYKIIELDMELSSDNKIIMLHDWDRTTMHYFGTNFPKKLSQSQFLNLSVYGELEVLTFEKLAEILKKNKDVRIVTDTKGDNLEVLTAISDKYPDLVNRFIPQIYDYDQWDKVKEIGYTDIIFTLYAMADLDIGKLTSFVKTHDIYAVAMPDYLAERGICRQLSDKGITVYVHPVSNYEDALQYMKQGAFGVYSGSLLRSEFDGIEKDYYLTVYDSDGSINKLTDDRIDDWKELMLHGQKPGDTVLYYLDQSRQCANDEAFANLEPGKHLLTIKIFNKNVLKGTLDYCLWQDKENVRVLHKKFEYRHESVKQGKDFATAIQDESIRAEVREFLEHSLIAKEGEYFFYNNGNPENYLNGEELLPVQRGSYGRLLLPLSTTIKRLGATSVTMSSTKDITIVFNGEKSMVMANSSIVRKGFRSTRLKTPVALYLNKAMAGGEFYRIVTARNYIEKNGEIIILPSGVVPNSGMEKELLEAAEKLF